MTGLRVANVLTPQQIITIPASCAEPAWASIQIGDGHLLEVTNVTGLEPNGVPKESFSVLRTRLRTLGCLSLIREHRYQIPNSPGVYTLELGAAIMVYRSGGVGESRVTLALTMPETAQKAVPIRPKSEARHRA